MEESRKWASNMQAIEQLRNALEGMRAYNTTQAKKDSNNYSIASNCNNKLFEMILALDRIEDALTDTDSYTV